MRIPLIAFFCFFAAGIKAQPVSFFCPDTAKFNEPEFSKMASWIEKAEEKIWLTPLDAVHHFYSPEAIAFNWKDYPCLSITYHLKLAEALKRLGAYDEADKAGLIAYQIDTTHGRLASQIIVSMLASIAYESKEYTKAARYYDLNYNIVKDHHDPLPVLGALNNHALALLQLDSVAKAREIFRKALNEYDHDLLGPRTLLASLYDNLAEVELRDGDTSNAIQLLHKKDSVLQLISPDTLRMFETYARLSQLYMAKGEIQKGLHFLSRAEIMATNEKSVSAEKTYHLELQRFEYLLSAGYLDAANRSLKKLQNLRHRSREDLLAYQKQEADVLRSYANYSVSQERALANIQLEKKEQEQLYQQRLTYLALIFGVILAFSIYTYFYYRTKTNKQKIKSLELSVELNSARLKNQELEKELLKTSLDASERELVSIAMDNAKRKEWTRDVMEKIDSVLEQPLDKQSDGFKKLYLQLVHQFQIQDRLSLTQQNQEIIPKSFLHKLRTNYPDLSPTEIDLCILIRLGLSGKEIAVIRNVDPESIRKAKYRLRSKMKAPDPEAFHTIINSI